MMAFRGLLAILRKEFRHILREPQTIFMTTIAPAFVLFLLAYTFSVDMDTVRIGIYDQDRSAVSRRYISGMTADGDVILVRDCTSYYDVHGLLQRGDALAVIVIPPGFGDSVVAGAPKELQLVLDGSDYHGSQGVQATLMQRTAALSNALLDARGAAATVPLVAKTRALYNVSLKWLYAMVPGLMAAAFCFPAIAVALACTREIERGSYEGLLATPIGMGGYLLGKLIPYLVTGSIGAFLCWVVATTWFRVPFRGRLVEYMLLAAVFLVSQMSLGILVGSAVANQRQAIIIVLLLFFVPTMFLSGLLQPLDADALSTKVLKIVLPAANYVASNRALFLKGLGIADLWSQVWNLVRIAIVALVLGFVFSRRVVA